MTSSLIKSCDRIKINQEIQTHTAKYVEAVKACDEKEERGKIRRTILVVHEISPEKCRSFCNSRARFRSMDEVHPFPSLARQESNATKDRPKHPFLNGLPIHTMSCFNCQYHSNATHDQNKSHDTHEYQRQFYAMQKRNCFINSFRYWPVVLRKNKVRHMPR